MLDNRYELVAAQQVHLDGMAAAKLVAMPGEFLTLLGRAFIRAFYAYYIRRPEGISLVVVEKDSGMVVGVVAGGDPGLRNRFVRTHLVRFLVTLFCKMLVHQRVRRRLAYHLASGVIAVARTMGIAPWVRQSPPPEDPGGTWANLLSIFCLPEHRGRGVGSALLDAFRIESGKRGYRWMRLSVHSDNLAAIAMYMKAGWQPVLTLPSMIYFRRSVETAT